MVLSGKQKSYYERFLLFLLSFIAGGNYEHIKHYVTGP